MDRTSQFALGATVLCGMLMAGLLLLPRDSSEIQHVEANRPEEVRRPAPVPSLNSRIQPASRPDLGVVRPQAGDDETSVAVTKLVNPVSGSLDRAEDGPTLKQGSDRLESPLRRQFESTPLQPLASAPSSGSASEPISASVPVPKKLRMFPPFQGGRIKWEAFDLPVVKATPEVVRVYLFRMYEFYGEFDRANSCRTETQRIEQAGRFIIQCDQSIGFDGVVVPDSLVEWTKMLVQVIQIRAESMYLPYGVAEAEFRLKHKEADLHAQANRIHEQLLGRKPGR
jgi:hypothetical protein